MEGVWFDDIHSYENLNLILSKVEIPPAVPKTNFVDLKLCTNKGVVDEKFTKKDKVAFKKASKIKINELM